ncbi:MAG: hypothetical protein ACLTDR_05600 [Adlercreutzia equolifaciens]
MTTGTYEGRPGELPRLRGRLRENAADTTGSSRPTPTSSSSGRAVWPSRIASAATWV